MRTLYATRKHKNTNQMHAPNANIVEKGRLGYVKMKQMTLPTLVSRVAEFNSETSLLMESFVPF